MCMYVKKQTALYYKSTSTIDNSTIVQVLVLVHSTNTPY